MLHDGSDEASFDSDNIQRADIAIIAHVCRAAQCVSRRAVLFIGETCLQRHNCIHGWHMHDGSQLLRRGGVP